MVDREARPDATFSIPAEELEEIGEACLKYSGRVNGRTMPVGIGVLEIGPGTLDQQARLQAFRRSSLRARVIPFGMIVDTNSRSVWSSQTRGFLKGPYHGFVEKLLTVPREANLDLTPPVVATSPSSFPFVTASILLVLAAVFAAEIIFGIGPWTKLLQPTNVTLVAFGAIMKSFVLQSGEWYRLLSAPFLHADIGHLIMNAIALWLAGRVLEPLVGRAWFGTIYAMAALYGSVLSVTLNSATTLVVGASGAIMGLFAAMLVISAHFPPGAIRTRLQMSAIYVLIPSLLPLAGALKGHKVDYASHFGGALGGVAIGLLILGIWSRSEALPRFRRAAAAIALASVAALIYPAMSVSHAYSGMSFASQLIPANELPKTSADMRTRATELIAKYPHDPRPRFIRAAELLDANDPIGAEREARAGLADEDSWRQLLVPQFGNNLRVVLALAINKDRHEEALQTARPACDAIKDGPMRRLLDDRKLCGT
ncbi:MULTISPECIES: rhomboid family intramembrane serine protease [unclassified Bradyrhizobium]|uniref:rhomboid family intramembrane serine protease n=1 Tax=unclassified Bradyrhizobium TaxID=2631580 RepID=UPI00247A3B14|nr:MULTISPECIES: rhomboid family intramembrane serine protease [unclassified Bradyrhizobium]WGS18349.1 rhomboid family intramembrane serine protease [Bradyrhizobium sp. ISRA463]WGS25165.1 rhomboid family intramembrane serine protease [Bradyrhizobium sp. ISRA464]